MQLNAFQKNFLFTLSSLLIVGSISGGSYWTYTYVKEKHELKRIADIERRVKRVMDMNVCAKLSDNEKDRLERVRLDPIATRDILEIIHSEHCEYWRLQMDKNNDALKNINRVYRNSSESDYYAALMRLHKNTQMAIAQFCLFSSNTTTIRDHDPYAPFEGEKTKK